MARDDPELPAVAGSAHAHHQRDGFLRSEGREPDPGAAAKGGYSPSPVSVSPGLSLGGISSLPAVAPSSSVGDGNTQVMNSIMQKLTGLAGITNWDGGSGRDAISRLFQEQN